MSPTDKLTLELSRSDMEVVYAALGVCAQEARKSAAMGRMRGDRSQSLDTQHDLEQNSTALFKDVEALLWPEGKG